MSPFSPSPALPPTERFSGRETKTGVGKVAQIEAVLIRRDYPPPFGKMSPFSRPRPLPPPTERFSRGETNTGLGKAVEIEAVLRRRAIQGVVNFSR